MTFSENLLISRLTCATRDSFLKRCEKLALSHANGSIYSAQTIDHVYFPVEGFINVLAQGPNASKLIIAMVGREGMLDPRAILGTMKTPLICAVHGEGWSWRMPVLAFQQQLNASSELKNLMDRYVAATLDQAANLALCLQFHDISARLARWLLMCRDRTGENRCSVTQEELGVMLGVRRVSVTKAASALEQLGAIKYRRGIIQLLDCSILERAACSCYSADLKSYNEIMG